MKTICVQEATLIVQYFALFGVMIIVCIILGFVNEMMSEAASGFIHSILFKQIKSKSLISREKINQAIVDLIDDALLFISSDYDVVFTVIFMPFMVNVKL